MLAARNESAQHTAPGEARPKILAYVRSDEAGFMHSLQSQGLRGDALEVALQQFNLARQFVREQFHDAESGTNVGAYTEFGEPLTFAGRLRLHLRNLLDAMLPDAGPRVWDRPPYQGLEAFDVEHAAIFCGREREVCELDERFRAARRRAVRSCCWWGLAGRASRRWPARLAALPVARKPRRHRARWLPAVLTPAQAEGGDLAGLLRAAWPTCCRRCATKKASTRSAAPCGSRRSRRGSCPSAEAPRNRCHGPHSAGAFGGPARRAFH